MTEGLPAGHDGPPVFDREPLLQVANSVDPEFAQEIAELYLAQLDEMAAAVRAGLRSGDREAGRRAAHNLKASSGQVGAVGLAALCRQVEASDGRVPEHVTTELNDLVAATRNALEGEWKRPG